MRSLLALALLASLLLAGAPPATAQGDCGSVPYDCRAYALELSSQRPLTFTLDTRGSTKERLEPEPCVLSTGTVWARFTAQTSGVARVTMASPSSADFGLVAYRDAGREKLLFEACRSHYAQGSGFELRIDCVAGATYYLQMGAYTQDVSTLRLTGCGAADTGLAKESGDFLAPGGNARVNVHEAGSETTPCVGACGGSRTSSYDLDATAALHHPSLVREETLVDFRFEATVRAAGVDTNTGGLVLEVGPPSRPPPPPPCGAGCTPGEILAWLLRLPAYAQPDAMNVHVEYQP